MRLESWFILIVGFGLVLGLGLGSGVRLWLGGPTGGPTKVLLFSHLVDTSIQSDS